MIAGDTSSFGIEIVINNRLDNRWVYGQFFIWVDGRRLGDPGDSVDLQSSVGWIKKLISQDRDLRDDALYSMKLEDLMSRMGNLGIVSVNDHKFHIDYIAMSSFDKFKEVLILIKNGANMARLIWSTSGEPPKNRFFKAGEIDKYFSEIVHKYELELSFL